MRTIGNPNSAYFCIFGSSQSFTPIFELANINGDRITIALEPLVLDINVDLDGTVDCAIALKGNSTKADFNAESVFAEDSSDTSHIISIYVSIF